MPSSGSNDMTWTTVTTNSGRAVDLLLPDPTQICIADIAFALARINRWSGHHRDCISVASHSLHVCDVLEVSQYTPLMRMHGLLHDAAEAYIGDITRPMRAAMSMITRQQGWPIHAAVEWIEGDVMKAIYTALGLPRPTADEARVIERVDEIVFYQERNLMTPTPRHPRPLRYSSLHTTEAVTDAFVGCFNSLLQHVSTSRDVADSNPFSSP
jgi:hypothetical protein